MLLTEDEARKKWCPFVRQTRGSDFPYNRDHNDLDGCRCIASDCMAWRWSNPHEGHCGLASAPAE